MLGIEARATRTHVLYHWATPQVKNGNLKNGMNQKDIKKKKFT
jgi:hypothetical protein